MCLHAILVRIYRICIDVVPSSQDVLRARVRTTGIYLITGYPSVPFTQMYNYFMFHEAFFTACANSTLVRLYSIYSDYVPSSQDVLRARVRTTGVHIITVNMSMPVTRMYNYFMFHEAF